MQTSVVTIVGAAVVRAGRVLAAQRAAPPQMAGRWEFPGGKVEPGESDLAGLIRECQEELGIQIEPGQRLGADVWLNSGAVLRVWLAEIVDGEPDPEPYEHLALRWLASDELDEVPWLPADRPLVDALRPVLEPAAG